MLVTALSMSNNLLTMPLPNVPGIVQRGSWARSDPREECGIPVKLEPRVGTVLTLALMVAGPVGVQTLRTQTLPSESLLFGSEFSQLKKRTIVGLGD